MCLDWTGLEREGATQDGRVKLSECAVGTMIGATDLGAYFPRRFAGKVCPFPGALPYKKENNHC